MAGKRQGKLVEAGRIRVDDEVQWSMRHKAAKVVEVKKEGDRVVISTTTLGTRAFGAEDQVIRLDPPPPPEDKVPPPMPYRAPWKGRR